MDIHLRQNDIGTFTDGQRMLLHMPVNMTQRFVDYIVQHLCRRSQLHSPVLHTADGKQILDQIDQPDRIVINVGIELTACRFIKSLLRIHQHARVSGNGSQRRSQIMRNRTQKIGAQLLILRFHCRLFFIFDGADVFHRKLALADDRAHDAFRELIESGIARQNTDRPIRMTSLIKRSVAAAGAGIDGRPRAGLCAASD